MTNATFGPTSTQCSTNKKIKTVLSMPISAYQFLSVLLSAYQFFSVPISASRCLSMFISFYQVYQYFMLQCSSALNIRFKTNKVNVLLSNFHIAHIDVGPTLVLRNTPNANYQPTVCQSCSIAFKCFKPS